MMGGVRGFAAGGLVVVIAGCRAVGPDYETPELPMPDSFVSERDWGIEDGAVNLDEWWKSLDDEVLDRLIRRALEGNLDLHIALARIEEARARAGIQGTRLWPTVDVSGSYQKTQRSDEVAFAFGPRTMDMQTLGLDVGWEVDVWGRVRRGIEAADADVEARVELARSVLVSLLAETARTYVELRAFQERYRIAHSNLELQTRTLELTENQFNAQLVSQLDVAQARSILEETRSRIPPLETSARAARNRLAVLLGLMPGALEQELLDENGSAAIPVPSVRVAVGVPAELLRRRPDVREAERTLAAQTARVGVATADLYPRFSLLGSLGLEADDASDLLQESAGIYSILPSLSWNVFDRRRLHDAIRVEDTRVVQSLAKYELTVQRALEEVENAMTGFVRDQQSHESLGIAVLEARRAVELSQDQYRQGLVSFQSVLDSQRRLFELEDRLAVTMASITTNLILLYKALGGGWTSRDVVMQDVEEVSS